MSYTEKLNEILKKASLDGDLRSEILTEHMNELHSLKTERKELLQENHELKGIQNNAENRINELSACVDARDNEINSWELREQELIEREKQIVILELKAEHAEIRRQDTMDMFRHVTKNPTLTVTKSGNIPIAVDGSDACCGFVASGAVDTKESTQQE